MNIQLPPFHLRALQSTSTDGAVGIAKLVSARSNNTVASLDSLGVVKTYDVQRNLAVGFSAEFHPKDFVPGWKPPREVKNDANREFDMYTVRPVTDICFASPNTVLVGLDGAKCCKMLDLRTGKTVLEARLPYKTEDVCSVAASYSVGGANQTLGVSNRTDSKFIAVGGKRTIFTWDVRNTRVPLLDLTGFHREDVTQVSFHPVHDNVLCSSSTDATINVFDLNKVPSELLNKHLSTMDPDLFEDALDDCLLFSMMADQAIEKFGFFGKSSEFLYAISTTETLGLFNIEQASMIAHHTNIKQVLTQQIPQNRPQASAKFQTVAKKVQEHKTKSFIQEGMNVNMNRQVGRLLNCHYHPSTEQLILGSSTFDGLFGLASVNLQSADMFSLQAGHADVVNDYIYLDEQTILTGGSDGKIGAWSSTQSVATKAVVTAPMSSSKSRSKKKAQRYTPF